MSEEKKGLVADALRRQGIDPNTVKSNYTEINSKKRFEDDMSDNLSGRGRQSGRSTQIAEEAVKRGAVLIVHSRALGEQLKQRFPDLKYAVMRPGQDDRFRGIPPDLVLKDHYVEELEDQRKIRELEREMRARRKKEGL